MSFKTLKRHLPSILFIVIMTALAGGLSFELLAQNQSGKPDTKVTVKDFSPKNRADQKSNITIGFSNDLVLSDSLDKIISNPPIKIKPPIPGIARWIETNKLRFYPDKPLAPATEYKVEVVSSESFINGNRIKEGREFKFYTSALAVSNVWWESVYEKQHPKQLRLNIDISFNYKVNVDQIRKKLSIEGGENATISHLNYEMENVSIQPQRSTNDNQDWQESGNQYSNHIRIITEPIAVTDRDQEYYLAVKSGLNCDGCGKAMENDYVKKITVSKFRRFKINQMRANIEGQKGVIIISLSSQVSVDYLKDYISVSPKMDFMVEKRYHTIAIKGDFVFGQTYEVTLAPGIPAMDGAVLENEFSSMVTIPNMPPTLKFVSQGVYLPKKGAKYIELETINVDSISIEVEQIFANNLVYAMVGNYTAASRWNRPNVKNVGRSFFSETKGIEGELNKPLATTLDIGAIIGDTARGVFKVMARKKTQRWDRASRLVMLTDIGIMAKLSDNYLMVWANSLSEVKPLSSAMVQLFSRNNQLLLKGKTDSRGIIIFDEITDKLEGFEPFLITVEKGDDLSYLKFNECLLSTSDFDIKGRPYLFTGYDAYLYLDRDIFRPGDTAHIASIVRGNEGTIPPEFPYFLIIRDPSGREFKSFRVKTSGSGFLEIELPIPDFARTGKYSIIAKIGDDYEIGRCSFQVEEFMPDRIKTTVSTPRTIYNTGDTVAINVTGKYLFGPPTAGHKVSGHITIEPFKFTVPNKSGFTFTDSERKFSRIETDLRDQILDDTGYYKYSYTIPPDLTPPSALKGLIAASVSEQGGRVVNAYSEIEIYPYEKYVGLKLNFEGYAKPGEPFEAGIIAVNSDGQPELVKNITAEFYRLIYHSILKQDKNGYYRYVSEKKPVLIDTVSLNLPVEGTTVSFAPPEYGNYKLVVRDNNGGHSSAVTFYASGWGYSPWSMEKPDRIEIDLEKEYYKPGDNATVQIRAPFGGKLLLTIEKDKVFEFISYEMEDNTAEINIPVMADYFPNAYISATIIKKASDVDKTSPARAYGIVPLKLSLSQCKLEMNIDAPDVVKSGDRIKIELQTENYGVSEISVSAVDAGIIQLTDYKIPDPLNYFYGQRKLYLKPYDLYSFIYPEVERASSHLSPGGGRAEKFDAARKRHLNPVKSRRVKPISLWSGIIKTDVNGLATVEFDLPEFNGKLEVMAVAVNGEKFGSNSTEIIVRDKIILQESFPRFVSPSDIVEGLVTVFNNTGGEADISVNLDYDGPVELISSATQSITLKNNSEGNVKFRFKSILKPGVIHIRLSASDGVNHTRQTFEMPNRPAMPLVTRFGSGVVRKNVAAFFEMPDDFIDITDQYVIKTSGLSAVAFTRNINFLLRYPYGCLEQTTSRLFPMLYFGELIRFARPELIGSRGADYFIQEGIIKLSGMMNDNGSFSYWPGGDRVHNWSSVYASHFLLEAQKAGYYLNDYNEKRIRRNLRDIARGKHNSLDEAVRIYAAYVLAGAGKLEKKIDNYLRDINTEKLRPFSRYQLAGALVRAGDKETALTLIPTDIQPAVFESETGGTFSSGNRTNAILLEVLNEIDPENPSCAVLAKDLTESSRIGHWYTTQETAFALMALGKYFKGQSSLDFDALMRIGDSTYNITPEDFQLIKNDIGGENVQITLDGDGSCFYFWQASGVPIDNAPEEFVRGIDVSREYLDVNGNPLNLENVSLGSQIICHIKARATDKHLQNVIINDLLPAGFEIENPRLKTTPLLNWVPKPGKDIEHQDIRDDRLLLFTNLNPKRATEFYYSLRVVSAGEFKIPPIAAECMYNPSLAGSSSSGFLKIESK